ncbi:type I restriction endonuclease subunit R [Selenomonas ruminantium]|uniref:Type I restriction enzyme endonuclease subunit n=1 Tax=Selenomonas ruminantium TaxID=971 RepID=A0A1H4AIG7_SELRU|nr:HsdR family type I site-specific deoxyribonuclease [Selenomonas ruminantium]SEA35710.1 type I restriction enzyme, R subunit [Selenomonas ruminantium]
MAQSEAAMEKALITQLTQDISQWTYRKDIVDEASLWANFRQKLNQNNQAVLDGVPITDVEFSQIQQYMLDVAKSPYKAALWLAGENGEAVIPLTREDASKGSIHLMAISNREIAGGRSSYEVINQFVSSKLNEDDRVRRFDVTLLINGLPMIHIELKNQDHPFMDAFRQIKKYSLEGKFRGLFGMVQMFVVSNGSNTRYIAADTGSNLNEKFLTTWVNKANEPVENYLEFAKEVLRIPEAHEMIGHYSVVDSERHKLILLRPYQVHAIEAVKRASANQESGFVWHTTGSGKTLTSYTVAKNLILIPNVDKTIFLIDRKDLDQQTSISFKAYAENDIIDVDETDNTHDLLAKLRNKDRVVIVTTIQKLQKIMKTYTRDDKKDSPTTKRLHGLCIAFVVDECHRTVTPDTQRELQKFFMNSLWYGFTGTPIFEENQRQRKGDLARTTEGLYGPCLHNYTIKEALNNKAVLGFQIDYKDSISKDKLIEIGTALQVASEDDMANMEADKLEEKVLSAYYKNNGRDIYDNDEHRKGVVEYIINKAAGKFRLNAPQGEAYEAILTVPSIEIAQKYYQLFHEFIAAGNVSAAIKEKCIDFPKIAITYTVTENDEDSIGNQQAMKESLADYNQMFGTNFALDSLSAYNTNLNDRLARKKGRYQQRKEQLDIVIVVDRLLTGFDAPPCAILFVDRPPMAPQNLIQAFSRTNRIYDKSKRYGMIVIFQRSAQFQTAVDGALLLYSNGGTKEVSAPTFEEIETEFKEALAELRSIAPTPAAADSFHDDVSSMQKFAKAFQRVDRLSGELQVYQEWEDRDISDYGIVREEMADYGGKYQNVIEELRKPKPDQPPVTVDVGYELENINSVTIDYRYIVSLIQHYMPSEDELVVAPIEDEGIDRHIEKLRDTNPALANVISDFWEDMKKAPMKYRGLDAMSIIETRIEEIIKNQIDNFAKEWCTQKKDVIAILNTFKKGDSISMVTDYESYSKTHEGVSKLKYNRRAKDAMVELVEKIRPLRDK